jgi:hypothetical protein
MDGRTAIVRRSAHRLRARPLRIATAAAAMLAASGCGEEATAPPDLEIPGQLLLIGEAEGVAPDGRSIECFLDIVLDVAETERTPAEATYVGTHGGHVIRALLDDDGSGFSFDAFVGGEARIQIRTPRTLDVIFPANEDVDSRFWAGLHTLGATFTATPENAEGDWSCAPLDITEGYVDTAGVATGRWRLALPQ